MIFSFFISTLFFLHFVCFLFEQVVVVNNNEEEDEDFNKDFFLATTSRERHLNGH